MKNFENIAAEARRMANQYPHPTATCNVIAQLAECCAALQAEVQELRQRPANDQPKQA